MSLTSVMARIGEIQSRFGVSASLTSPIPGVADFSGLSVEEIVDLATTETAKVAGQAAASAVGASLLEALAVQRGDIGISGLTPSSTSAEVASLLPTSFLGPVTFPVPGFEVGSDFGSRVDPFEGDRRMHKGADIGAPAGTPVQAAGAGVVTWAGERGSYGNLVVVRHDDRTETRYAHQSEIAVEAGQLVSAGQVIGEVGSTGRSTGPHLHFEARVDGEAVDPVMWMEEHRR